MFSQACVKNSVHTGVVYTPLGRHPTWADTPRPDTPQGRHPQADTPAPPPRRRLQRTVRILLECILVLKNYFIYLPDLRSLLIESKSKSYLSISASRSDCSQSFFNSQYSQTDCSHSFPRCLGISDFWHKYDREFLLCLFNGRL